MPKTLLITALVLIGHALHLRQNMHVAVPSSQLTATLQSVLAQLRNANQSIDQTKSALNPYSQLDRISSL